MKPFSPKLNKTPSHISAFKTEPRVIRAPVLPYIHVCKRRVDNTQFIFQGKFRIGPELSHKVIGVQEVSNACVGYCGPQMTTNMDFVYPVSFIFCLPRGLIYCRVSVGKTGQISGMSFKFK